jgi:YfiR/HmsC-like
MAKRGQTANPSAAGTSRPLIAFILLSLTLLSGLAVGDSFATVDAARVEAAFLRNFAHYVIWPRQAFADDKAPWQVCIIGDDPFDDILDATFRGRTEQGRSFVVRRVSRGAQLKSCQLAYVAFRTAETRRAVLSELANHPVLTVGNAPQFLQEGGIIRFSVSDHVEFAVNLDRANAVALKIPTKVLEVAQLVVENGVSRRRR